MKDKKNKKDDEIKILKEKIKELEKSEIKRRGSTNTTSQSRPSHNSQCQPACYQRKKHGCTHSKSM